MADHLHQGAFGAPATGWGLTSGTARAPCSWSGHPQPLTGTGGRPGFGRARDAAGRTRDRPGTGRPAQPAGRSPALDLSLGHKSECRASVERPTMSNCYHDRNGDHDSSAPGAAQGRSGGPGGIPRHLPERADGGGAEGLPRPPSHAAVRRAVASGTGCGSPGGPGPETPCSGPGSGLQAPGERLGPLPLRVDEPGRLPAQVEALPWQGLTVDEKFRLTDGLGWDGVLDGPYTRYCPWEALAWVEVDRSAIWSRWERWTDSLDRWGLVDGPLPLLRVCVAGDRLRFWDVQRRALDLRVSYAASMWITRRRNSLAGVYISAV